MEDLTLVIDFVGHCMFATEDERLTVLMPAPLHVSPNPGDHHYARLNYCAVAADGKARWKCESLMNRELDLSPYGGESFKKPDLRNIANIWQVTNQKLDRNLVNGPNPENVRSRVKVGHGSGAPVSTLPVWDLKGYAAGALMSNRTRWTIGKINNTSLTLTGLHGEPDAGPFVIEPINGVVRLEISHVPRVEVQPQRGEFAEHFAHYYNLFPAYTGQRVLPRYNPSGEKSKVPPGHLVTCMHAQAPVGP